jgi:hypothetical protein
VDLGHCFVTDQKKPIFGHKTQEEVEEEGKLHEGMVEYMKNHSAYRAKQEAQRKPVPESEEVKKWTPRLEDMPIEQAKQVPIKAWLATNSGLSKSE